MNSEAKSCFLYNNLKEFRNIGIIIRNIVKFQQIFIGNYSNTFKKNVLHVTMLNRYPDQPQNFRYSELSFDEEINNFIKLGYRIIILETENWHPDVPRISLEDFKKSVDFPTLYIFGNEKLGVPELAQLCKIEVLTLGNYSQSVSAIAIRLDTLLRF